MREIILIFELIIGVLIVFYCYSKDKKKQEYDDNNPYNNIRTDEWYKKIVDK